MSAVWDYFTQQVSPNLVASVLWSTPIVIVHHVLMKRHINKVVNKDGGR